MLQPSGMVKSRKQQTAPRDARVMRLTGPPFVREVRRPMSTARMLAAVTPQAVAKRQGYIREWFAPGPMTVRQRGLRFEPAHIEAYRRVCTYGAQPASVPMPYPEMHFTPLIAEAAVSARFPVSPLGLIHVAQRVEVLEPLRPGDEVDANTELDELRETDRGYELDFSMTLERKGHEVWRGLATLLSRSAATRSGKKRRVGAEAATPARTPDEHTLELAVAGDTGLRYARVSGDWNPHHLWWFTAKPLGYRRPIAHGMWTFARVLSEVLEGVEDDAPLVATTAFKRPLLMPSRIRIEAPRLSPATPEVQFAAYEAGSGAPHLIGDAAYAQ
jgi:acyl dehydratase